MCTDNKYVHIINLCDKYKCELLTNENDFNATKNITVKSSCGHISHVTYNKFVKNKIGIYCTKCFDEILLSQTTCFKCSTSFTPTTNSFLYCSINCTQSRGMTDERRQKIKLSILNRYDSYKNDNGELKTFEEISTIKKKRKYEHACEKRKESDNAKPKIIVTYDTIKKMYEDNGCQLLTTEDEYLELKKTQNLAKILFKIISSCGHPSDDSLYYSFVESNTCKLCKKCTHNNMIQHMKQYAKTTYNYTQSSNTQKKAMDIIEELCKNKFTMKKTRDGCKSNILIRQINSEEDNWLQINLKSTNNASNNICFRIRKIYENVPVLMVGINSNKQWLFVPTELNVTTYYKKKQMQKHDNNVVANIEDKFKELYEKQIYNTSFNLANTPISKAMQLEYSYVNKRENTIKFLKFQHNDITGLVYNFKIGNLKVQENVFSYQSNKNSLIASLNKNFGKGIRNPYCIGDCDIYWFNENTSTETFYVVPEQILVDQGYIQTEKQSGKKYLNILTNKSWLYKYTFSYKTINNIDEKNRLMTLLEA